MVRVRYPIFPAGLLALTLSAGAALPAWAQDAPPVLPPQQPNATQVPEKIDPPLDSAAPPTTGTLSEQLNKSDGVIKPPSGVDPEMHVPAPGQGSGVVIPPPGSDPGDPVQPK